MKSIKEFIKENGLEMTAVQVESRPDKTDDEWQGFHWKVEIKNGDRKMSIHYTMGLAHCKYQPMNRVELNKHIGHYVNRELQVRAIEDLEKNLWRMKEYQIQELMQKYGIKRVPNAPELSDVLDCLASDSSGVENARDFNDWAADYGYDEDSRKAEKIYNQCVEQRRELRDLLGLKLYEELLYEVERE